VTFCAPVVPAEGEHRRDVTERVRASLAQAGAATGERPRARHPEPAPH
jgi:hypothetical protein